MLFLAKNGWSSPVFAMRRRMQVLPQMLLLGLGIVTETVAEWNGTAEGTALSLAPRLSPTSLDDHDQTLELRAGNADHLPQPPPAPKGSISSTGSECLAQYRFSLGLNLHGCIVGVKPQSSGWIISLCVAITLMATAFLLHEVCFPVTRWRSAGGPSLPSSKGKRNDDQTQAGRPDRWSTFYLLVAASFLTDMYFTMMANFFAGEAQAAGLGTEYVGLNFGMFAFSGSLFVLAIHHFGILHMKEMTELTRLALVFLTVTCVPQGLTNLLNRSASSFATYGLLLRFLEVRSLTRNANFLAARVRCLMLTSCSRLHMSRRAGFTHCSGRDVRRHDAHHSFPES